MPNPSNWRARQRSPFHAEMRSSFESIHNSATSASRWSSVMETFLCTTCSQGGGYKKKQILFFLISLKKWTPFISLVL